MSRLDPLLRARSVAVVGASDRPGTVGHQTMRQLVGGGFGGQVFPVNPGYDRIGGLQSLPEIGAIGSTVDVAVLAVANARLEEQVGKAIAAGARSLVMFASCHGDAGDGSSLRTRLTQMVDEAGIPVCGGNGMGLVNVEDSLRLTGFFQPPGLRGGGISFLTHSGSLFSAVLHSQRDLGFNFVVSTGLELNTPMSDYLTWVLDQDSTRVVALFLETVRDPDGFLHALSVARDQDVPIVALTVGRSHRGRAAVATHSEAIAGEDAAYEAVFEAFGVHRVATMDEMMDTVELLAAGREALPGGLGAVHDSGGERTLLIDTAERVGVELPSVTGETRARLASLLDPGLEPENPVDAWGTGHSADEVFVGCLQALADDPSIGALAFSVDLTEEEDLDNAYGTAVLDAAAATSKPIAVLSNISTTVDAAQARLIRDGGVPVLQGTETGLRAIGHLLERAARATRPAHEERLTEPSRRIPDEPLELLSSYGIPFAPTERVTELASALAAANRIGFPVVLKTVADHKTEVDGVRLDLNDGAAVERAYLDLSERLGAEVTISPQVPAGVEVAVGMITDSQFGPMVVVSAGGTLIEILRDRVALLPPFDSHAARRALAKLVVSELLAGVRGADPANIASLVDLLVRFSELASDTSPWVDSIDLNPVIVGPDGAVAVDVLMKRRHV